MEQGNEALSLGFVGDLQLLLFATEPLQARAEGWLDLRLLQVCVDGPEFLFCEGLNFTLAFDDKTNSDGLYPTGGQSASDFRPEERTQPVADQPV